MIECKEATPRTQQDHAIITYAETHLSWLEECQPDFQPMCVLFMVPQTLNNGLNAVLTHLQSTQYMPELRTIAVIHVKAARTSWIC